MHSWMFLAIPFLHDVLALGGRPNWSSAMKDPGQNAQFLQNRCEAAIRYRDWGVGKWINKSIENEKTKKQIMNKLLNRHLNLKDFFSHADIVFLQIKLRSFLLLNDVSESHYVKINDAWWLINKCFTLRDVEKNNYPIVHVFWSVFFVATKFKYPDMLASSCLEYEPKSFAIWDNYLFPRP